MKAWLFYDVITLLLCVNFIRLCDDFIMMA